MDGSNSTNHSPANPWALNSNTMQHQQLFVIDSCLPKFWSFHFPVCCKQDEVIFCVPAPEQALVVSEKLGHW